MSLNGCENSLSFATFQVRNLPKFPLALPLVGSIKRKRKRLGSQGGKWEKEEL